ncbi:hypothetical protein KEM54_000083 [Ascosphaera aggregata]|nr:hypothetical protein KEM54_000083 [Ascosphaera aggregata]
MDNLQDGLRGQLLTILNTFTTYIPPSIVKRATSLAIDMQQTYSTYHVFYIQPYIITPIRQILDSPPTIGNLLSLLILFWLSLRLLDYTRRVVIFWVMLVLRLAFWGAVGVFGWYVYTAGWEEAWGMVVGIVSGIHGMIVGFVDGNLNAAGASARTGGRRTGLGIGRERYDQAARQWHTADRGGQIPLGDWWGGV